MVSESSRISSLKLRLRNTLFFLAEANCWPCHLANLGLASHIILIPARKLLLPSSSSDRSLSLPSLIRVNAVFLRDLLTLFKAVSSFFKDVTLSPEVDLSSSSLDFDGFLSAATLAALASSRSFFNLALSASLRAFHSSAERRPVFFLA